MIPQLHFDIPEPPPVLPVGDEPPLLSRRSPQRDRVLGLLIAAREAADAFEFERPDPGPHWRLRIVVPGDDPDGRLSHPGYGLSVASAVSQVLVAEGRTIRGEAHLGDLARFALLPDAASIGHVLLDPHRDGEVRGAYHVSLVAERSGPEFTIPREDGWEEPVKRPKWMVRPPQEYSDFIRCLNIARMHYLASRVAFHINRGGGWFEFSGPAFDGQVRRFGPVKLWSGERLPIPQPASIPLQRAEIHSIWLAFTDKARGNVWPPVVLVSPPAMRGDIRLMAGLPGDRHTHLVTSFDAANVSWGEARVDGRGPGGDRAGRRERRWCDVTPKIKKLAGGLAILIVLLVPAALLTSGGDGSATGTAGFDFDAYVTDREAILARATGSEYAMEREFSSVAIWWALTDLCVRESSRDEGACYDEAAGWLESLIARDVRDIRTDDWAGAIGGAMNIVYNETAKQLGIPKASDPNSAERLDRPPMTWSCVPDCASAIGQAD